VLTENGEKLATTSEKGIQVRIFDTRNGHMLQEVRRGNEYATIYSLAFSHEGNWLAVSSDSSNLHIFAIHPSEVEVLHHLSRGKDSTRSKPKSSSKTPKANYTSLKAYSPTSTPNTVSAPTTTKNTHLK
jgi:WD repeat-containing protein 45